MVKKLQWSKNNHGQKIIVKNNHAKITIDTQVLKPGTVWSGKGGTGGTGNEDIATHDVAAHSGGR